MNGPRTYLHGDPTEGEAGRYFCDRCDAAVDRAHFAGCVLGAGTREGRRFREPHAWLYVQVRRVSLRSFAPGDDRRIVDDLAEIAARRPGEGAVGAAGGAGARVGAAAGVPIPALMLS